MSAELIKIFTKEFNESVKNAELVVEAVHENFELKKKTIDF